MSGRGRYTRFDDLEAGHQSHEMTPTQPLRDPFQDDQYQPSLDHRRQSEQSFYDNPVYDDPAEPHERRSSQYAPQEFRMPEPELRGDDLYRLGTPDTYYDPNQGYNYGPPPPPPQPYVEEDYDDEYDQENYSPGHEQEYEGRPILQSQTSQATLATDVTEKKWADLQAVTWASGNLVLNCPLPSPLLDKLPKKHPLEFSCMRYSAATCDPNEFVNEGYQLRQQLFARPRQTELFIVVTMYNEEEELFGRTMVGIFENIKYICEKAKDETWAGGDAWKKIVVCVVSDGREKINTKTRSLIAAMGCYQEGISKLEINDVGVQAHIYEHTTQVGIKLSKAGKNTKVEAVPGGLSHPVQLLFCLKEHNKQKINSHRWFFQAFGPALNPNICVLIDAGTQPGPDSIYHLWKAFYLNQQCAGACGEIKVMLSEGGGLLNPLVATQNFEYKMSNILDKPLESVFGFISVLPGAFSAYRYCALLNDQDGSGPLEMYFKGEGMHAGTVQAGILEKNMYLAEDRILCFELVTKKKSAWTLQYVKSAYAATDVPSEVTDLVKQRRRWLNGSFFAAVFALVNFRHIWRSDHSAMRKTAFVVEFIYQTVSLIFSWFSLANFFLVFRILTAGLGEPVIGFKPGKILSVLVEWTYFGVLFTGFILALGNKPDGSRKMYVSMVYIWGALMVYLIFSFSLISYKSIKLAIQTDADGKITGGEIFSNRVFRDLVVSMGSTYIIYFLTSFLYLEPYHMFTSILQYLFLSPTYINVMNVYAFCNVHDISWGTKGLEGGAKAGGDDKAKIGDKIKQSSKDRDQNYEEELRNLAGQTDKPAPPKTEAMVKAEQTIKDSYYYADVRCWVVLAWCATNFGLTAIILNSGGLNRLISEDADVVQDNRSTIYMAIILWSVAVLAGFRFIGSIWYLILRAFRGV